MTRIAAVKVPLSFSSCTFSMQRNMTNKVSFLDPDLFGEGSNKLVVVFCSTLILVEIVAFRSGVATHVAIMTDRVISHVMKVWIRYITIASSS